MDSSVRGQRRRRRRAKERLRAESGPVRQHQQAIMTGAEESRRLGQSLQSRISWNRPWLCLPVEALSSFVLEEQAVPTRVSTRGDRLLRSTTTNTAAAAVAAIKVMSMSAENLPTKKRTKPRSPSSHLFRLERNCGGFDVPSIQDFLMTLWFGPSTHCRRRHRVDDPSRPGGTFRPNDIRTDCDFGRRGWWL